jgi:hypothetical protein
MIITAKDRTENAAANLRKYLGLCDQTARIVDTSTADDRELDELDLMFYWSRAVFHRREYEASMTIDAAELAAYDDARWCEEFYGTD